VIGLVAGTGVVAVALDADGRELLADGRGFLLGDYGGAYWAGIEALRRGLRAAEREGGPSALLRALLDELGMAGTAELPDLITGSVVPVSRIASLAPVVCALAEEGEPIAAGVVADAITGLVETVAALERGLASPQAPSVRLTGGMLRAPLMRTSVETRLRDSGRFSEIVWVGDGVEGALALARAGWAGPPA
jgi:N-acetylglucosamine kinase-like BadF-type ATPase